MDDSTGPTLVDDREVRSASSGTTDMSILRQYWLILIRRRWIILAIVVTALLTGLVVTLLMTPQFTATTQVAINRQEQRITNLEGVEQSDASLDAEFYETQYALLRSRSVAERVARRLRLANDPAFFEVHGVEPAGSGSLLESSGPPSREELEQRNEQAVRLLLNHIEISPIARSSLVNVSYTSAGPTISANVANAWAAEFIADSVDRRFASTADARRFLETRLAELRQKVQESDRDLVTYAQQKGIIVLDRSTEEGKTTNTRTLVSANLQAMNDALAQATADRVALEARARTSGAANASSVNNVSIGSLRQRRAELEAQYAQMLVQFEPDYPAARAIRQQIDELDAAVRREEARVMQSIQGDYRAAVDREESLRSRVSALTQQLVGQERDRIQYNIFQNEVDTNRQLYDGLLQRYKEIGVAGVSANNIAVVDEAQIPQAPSSPQLPLNLLIALIGGFALAGLVVFALEEFEEGIRRPEDVGRLLNMPLLGAVPAVTEGEEVVDLIRDPKSEISEAYLTVRSNLAFLTDHGVPRSVMITSSRASEGKSRTSIAVATVLARTGKRVVLIDADMRSPSLNPFFDVPNEKGLSAYLAGDDDWRSMTEETDFPNLQLIPAGRIPPSAAELLSTDRMHVLVNKLLESVDHVVIDAPPLLGLADATLLARNTEGVIYVVEAQGLSARAINLSLQRLRDSHARIFGVVLTKLRRSKADAYGYGYGYGYGLRYGDEATS